MESWPPEKEMRQFIQRFFFLDVWKSNNVFSKIWDILEYTHVFQYFQSIIFCLSGRIRILDEFSKSPKKFFFSGRGRYTSSDSIGIPFSFDVGYAADEYGNILGEDELDDV